MGGEGGLGRGLFGRLVVAASEALLELGRELFVAALAHRLHVQLVELGSVKGK